LEFSERAGATKDGEKHGSREPSSVGVLQGGMEAGDDVKPTWHRELGTMSEDVSGARGDVSGALHVSQKAVKCDAAEADDHAQMAEQGDLLIKPWGAVAEFQGRWLVCGRRASRNGSDPEAGELHAVFS
jgi:hypothetical protein